MTDPKDIGRNSFLTWPKGLSERIRDAETKENLQMRQYRGLTKEGKWVYGWLVRDIGGKCFIVKDGFCLEKQLPSYASYGIFDYNKVIPETVGQQVRQNDKNNKEAYLGDLIKHDETTYEIKWCKESMAFYCDGNDWIDDAKLIRRSEIIGNIFDNDSKPEEQKHG